MGDALMNWDGIQSRWRSRYKGKMFRIKASDLGGTNSTDTKLAANRWFQERKAERDRELALTTLRPNEGEYLAELEDIQTTIKALSTAMRVDPSTQSALAPKIEVLKQKESLIKQARQQPTLPPLDDALRNPLRISPELIDREAFKGATQQIAGELREQGTIRVSREELQGTERYVGYDHPQLGLDDVDAYESNDAYFRHVDRINGWNQNLSDRILEDRIQEEAGRVVGLKDELATRERERVGRIGSESEWGQVDQILKEAGATVPVSRKLDYHIDKFLESKKQECKLGGIAPGRLKKINCTIDRYRKWSPIINGSVDRIGTKEHIEAYYSFLVKQVLAGEIKPKYAHNLFGDFKMMVFWLVNEEVLKDNPRCLQLKANKYTFPVVRQKPKTIPLPLLRRVLDVVTDNPRLKLFILLTLNCGFGASEIGKLRTDEYNPTTGRITHKRCKTEKSDNVPTVGYKLWNETRELLDQELANRKKYPKHHGSAEYLLVNSNGMPLWSESIDKGKSDNITCSFKRLIAKLCKLDSAFAEIAYYQLRRTSSTQISNEPRYRIYSDLWLGHAPQSVADKHYNVPEDTLLDECIAWLHGKIFGAETPPE